MRLCPISLLPVLLLLSASAGAQEHNGQGIVRGLCSKDGCDEFVILGKQPFATGIDGELFRTRVGTYHASNRGRAGGGEEAGYVYCSTTRPSIINAPPGQPPVAFMLAPDSGEPAWVQRTTTNFYALYFALCHGGEAGRAAVRDRQGVARSLGYHVARTKPETVTLRQVEQILGRGQEGAAAPPAR